MHASSPFDWHLEHLRKEAAYHSLFVPEKVPASYGFLDLYRQVRAAALHTQPAYK